MTPNPNPGRITDASWWFMGELVAMEPGTENSGIYGNKPGYHGTRSENDARSGVGQDYSCKATLDRQGPNDKAAGYDWTFKSAQAGDYRQMAKIGDRLEAAFNARDPRLAGWREALGQTDADKTAEGLDFQGWFRRTPDGTHSWHFHLSELRAFVASFTNKEAMLSVLAGETLAAYLARGGQLIGAGMADSPQLTTTNWRILEGMLQLKDLVNDHVNKVPQPNEMARILRRIEASSALAVQLVGLLAEAVKAGGGNLDTVAVLARIDERAAEDAARDAAAAARIAELEADVARLEAELAAVPDAVADELHQRTES